MSAAPTPDAHPDAQDDAPDDSGWLLAGPTSPDQVRAYYDGWAGEYDGALRAWGYDAPERAADLLLGALGGRATWAGSSVLDAGCGTGLAGAALRAAGFDGRLVGLDLSPPSLEVAAGRAVYDELHVANLQEPLTVADRAFDALLCVGVLTYVPDTIAVWREFARVVAPGGAVVCTQRADVWCERRCHATLDLLERDGTWTAVHLSPEVDYMPGNADFGHEIGVRYLVARIRAQYDR
jgi:ubiquinone/menaquinone biosynthesis C-methylase UbiE